MRARLIRCGVVLAGLAIPPVDVVRAEPRRVEDAIDRLMRLVPPARVLEHGYSDFTDPLGRFLDLLGAGAFVEARALQSGACAAWLATRRTSAFSGKVWVWDTEIDLDRLCGAG